MAPSIATAAARRHPVIPDTRPRMAKAHVGNPDIAQEQAWKERIGAAWLRTIASVGWTIDRAAMEMKLDPREVGKWGPGYRRVQVDRVMAVPELREPWALEMAVITETLEIVTQVRKAVNS